MNKKETLIDKVIRQIAVDVDCGDYTAIEELLKNVPTEALAGYLPEEESVPDLFENMGMSNCRNLLDNLSI